MSLPADRFKAGPLPLPQYAPDACYRQVFTDGHLCVRFANSDRARVIAWRVDHFSDWITRDLPRVQRRISDPAYYVREDRAEYAR